MFLVQAAGRRARKSSLKSGSPSQQAVTLPIGLQGLKHRFALAGPVFQRFGFSGEPQVGSIGLHGVPDWKHRLAKIIFDVECSEGRRRGLEGRGADAR